ncbi:hypothetical protein AUC61_19525 [Pseudomonas sp. S25]|uniref:Halovibrin HvnA n=1 Tax=Pseudomonas maioricensis TaxID=1766623 RepID=A0ABS9ZNK2_9PSED|nr:hypothetical protein [Pseudomonas sp. S25]MCI8211726.1 hypothetical protein [Pseudomonas sp. S25]
MRQLYTMALLMLGLSACSVDEVSRPEAPVQSFPVSISDQQRVDNLNARYQSTVEDCAEGTPAYYCSGVMLRTVTYSASYPFWTHSPGARELGSLTFSYIRKDIGSNGSDIGSGFIFTDQETAMAQNKAPIVRCIYPFMAGTQGMGRPGFGCGFVPNLAKQENDLSTCRTLSTPATTAALWLANFRLYGSNVHKQCSLSSMIASQFKASLEAHNGVDAAHTVTRNELLIGTWREETPEQLPIEAFFYNGATGGLLNVHALRRAYYIKTSQRLPIVRVNFSAADRNIFSWNEADQVDGWEVADRLNARYNDTAYDCEGKAAFYCKGVMARLTGYGPDYHSWNPNPAGSTDVSFSYLRKDLKFMHAIFSGLIEQGYIFKQANYFGQNGIYPLQVLCSFPYDAVSASRYGEGCGPSHLFPVDSRPCDEQGITTLAAWRTHFNLYPPVNYNRYSHQCGFKADQPGFALSLMARENPQAEWSLLAHNEILIDRWPQNIPTQLPIEAFFYIYDQAKAVGLEGAKFIQRDYFSQSRITAPVISVAFKTGGDNIFSYHPSDQAAGL